MKINQPFFTRAYETIVKSGKVFARICIQAENRREAVHKAELWFWYEYKGILGQVHKAMIVSNRYNEVHYGPKFICSDKMNKLLPPSVIDRLIVESNNELMRNERKGSLHHPPSPVRRVKRRRDFGIFVAPGIKRMKNRVLSYRVALSPKKSKDNQEFCHRKYKDVRLSARTLAEAIVEIEARELDKKNAEVALRKMKVRSLVFVSHVAGVTFMNSRNRIKFKKVLPRYEEPHA